MEGQYILGPDVNEFEERFKALCDVKYACSLANGTDALILAMKALNIGPGDEVITCSNSWVSSVSSIVLAGAKPVMIDVKDDMNMNPDLLEEKINSRTKAIMPVHLTGKIADMNHIMEVAAFCY